MMIQTIVILLGVIALIHGESQSVGRCARAAQSCLLAPQSTQGPYYWNSTVRKDITFVFRLLTSFEKEIY